MCLNRETQIRNVKSFFFFFPRFRAQSEPDLSERFIKKIKKNKERDNKMKTTTRRRGNSKNNRNNKISTKVYTILFVLIVCLVIYVLQIQDLRVFGVGESASSSNCEYGIAIDAGSSGTRLHVYRRKERHGLLEEMLLKKVSPGISSYVNNLEQLSSSISDLTKLAETVVPVQCRSSTPIHVMATAGMRLVPQHDRIRIFNAVRSGIRESSFQFQDAWASVITGQMEAVYDWISVNLAAGALPLESSTSVDSLVGAADLGGASAQLAYPVSDSSRNEPGVVLLSLPTKRGDVRVDVPIYAVSRLRYGMYEAHNQIISSRSEPIFPCDIHGGEPLKSDKIGTGRFDRCVTLIETFFKHAERDGLGDLLPQEAKQPPLRHSNMKLCVVFDREAREKNIRIIRDTTSTQIRNR